MATEWYYAVDGVRYGPVNAQGLKSLADSKKLLPTHLLWKNGLKTWVKAGNVNGLFTPLKDSPPPLPKIPHLQEKTEEVQTISENGFNERQPSSAKSNFQTEPTGVGGWLIFIIICEFLGSIAFALRAAIGFVSIEVLAPLVKDLGNWNMYQSMLLGSCFISAAMCIFGGLSLLISKKWWAVRYAKASLWILGPVYLTFMGIIIPALIFGKFYTLDAKMVISIIFSVIPAGIWTAYFSKSKRVRNTYGGSKQAIPYEQIKVEGEGKNDRDLSVHSPEKSKNLAQTSVKSVEVDLNGREIKSTNEPLERDGSQNDKFYEIIAQEFDEKKLIKLLWVKAFAIADGDYNKAKANYINLRFAQLTQVENELKEIEETRKENEIKDTLNTEINCGGYKTLGSLLNCAKKTGQSHAKYLLSKVFKEGKFISKDSESSKKWLIRAADEGYSPAIKELAEIEMKLGNNSEDAKDNFHIWSDDIKKRNIIRKCWKCGDIYHGSEYVKCLKCNLYLKRYKVHPTEAARVFLETDLR